MNRIVLISLREQLLRLMDGACLTAEFPISSAAKGAGQRNGSGQTPLGRHRVRLKVGAGAPVDTVFRGRRPTGEIYSPALAASNPGRDWILTRLLWLTGCVSGFNRGGAVDTLRRYIYIHGTPDAEPMGVPLSHGCIRMRNRDIIELFDQVQNGTVVDILPDFACRGD